MVYSCCVLDAQIKEGNKGQAKQEWKMLNSPLGKLAMEYNDNWPKYLNYLIGYNCFFWSVLY